MAERTDPFRNSNFILEIEGIQEAGFKECSGFGATVETVDYREGHDNQPAADVNTLRKLPGMTSYDNITLKWGLTDDNRLYSWFRRVSQGAEERKSGSIVVHDTQGNEKVRWNFENAWPTKWTGPTLDAQANDVAIETLELVHEGIVMKTPAPT